MSTPEILQTKLFIPPTRPELVPRPRLIERLNEGLHRKLTLVSAPAGFGKTTLIHEWVDQIQSNNGRQGLAIKVGWYSLDASDNVVTLFMTYVVTALHRLAGIGSEVLELLNSPQPPPIESVLTTLINDISSVDHQFLLVLDDYHLIDSTSIEDALAFLLEHLPPQLHLVLVTRDDPRLPLANLRAGDQMTELRALDLRFTSDEAANFLIDVMGLDLTDLDVSRLESRTEGWIAGLQMAAISIRGSEDASAFIASFAGSHQFVMDYLIEEVLDRQPESIKAFLLKTSVLDRLSGGLCDAVTNQKGSATTLRNLERANLFIVPLDERRDWYRYHHLFKDLLRQRLGRTYPQDRLKLHRLASGWYEKSGMVNEAIEHALKGEDYEQAADLIEGHIDHVLFLGERTTLKRWLDEVPEKAIKSRPQLGILQAGVLFLQGYTDEASRFLDIAEQALDPGHWKQEGDPLRKQLIGRAAVIRAYLVSFHGDVDGSLRHAQQALENLPPDDFAWRASALDCLGTTYSYIGNVASAYDARINTLEACREAGNIYMMLFAGLRLVVTLREMGRLQEAIGICQQQLQTAQEHGFSRTSLVGWLYALWGEMLAERNELDHAWELASKGVELTKRGMDIILMGSSYLCLLRVLYSRAEFNQALQIIQEINVLSQRPDFPATVERQLSAWQALIFLAQGNLIAANDWVVRQEIDLGLVPEPQYDFDYGVLARILIKQGEESDCDRMLGELLKAAQSGGRVSKTIELLALHALCLQARGEGEAALKSIEEALTLAEPEGFIRVFLDEGPPMLSLLQEARKRQIAVDYVDQLLAGSVPVDQSGLVEPLSERELEVLDLIAKGLTNRDIGEQLFLSLNTVKVHTRNIYGKLAVNNRTQAVARARELRLTPDS